MKQTAIRLTAIENASSGSVPSWPAICVIAVKPSVSNPFDSPADKPRRRIDRPAAQPPGPQKLRRRRPITPARTGSGCSRIASTSAAAASVRAAVDASAAPTAPSSGRPKGPKISSQLSTKFTTLAAIITTSPIFGRPVASR